MEFDIKDLSKLIFKSVAEPAKPWDDYCPIVETDDRLYIYLTNQIDMPSEYNEACHRIITTTKPIHIYINNGGGIIDSAVMLTDAIQTSEAHVTAYLSGTVASAATLITMACDDIVVAPYTQFMIHNYSGGVHGKGKEAKDQMEFVNAEIGKTFKQAYAGFLTEEELEDVIADHDKWMGKDEVLTRWENKKKLQG